MSPNPLTRKDKLAALHRPKSHLDLVFVQRDDGRLLLAGGHELHGTVVLRSWHFLDKKTLFTLTLNVSLLSLLSGNMIQPQLHEGFVQKQWMTTATKVPIGQAMQAFYHPTKQNLRETTIQNIRFLGK